MRVRYDRIGILPYCPDRTRTVRSTHIAEVETNRMIALWSMLEINCIVLIIRVRNNDLCQFTCVPNSPFMNMNTSSSAM